MPFEINRLDWRLVVIIVLVDAVLRGLALWKSARACHKWWFIALFLINSAGILPAIYLFLHRAPKSISPAPQPSPRSARKRARPV